MGVIRCGALVALLLLLIPGALALAPPPTAPPTPDPSRLGAGAAWDVATAPRCDEASTLATATAGDRTMGMRDDAWVERQCERAGSALAAPAPPRAASEGAAAARPAQAEPAIALAARVEVEDLALALALADAPAPDALAAEDAGPLASRGSPEAPIERRADARSEGAPLPRGPAERASHVWAPLARGAGTPAPAAPTAVAEGAAEGASMAAPVALAAALALCAAALYQRFARPDALAHPARAALHAALLARGSAGAGALAREAGLPRKTAEYHLTYLARAGLVREQTTPQGARVFLAPAARLAPTPEERLVALVREVPGLSASELAARAGMSRSRVDRLAKELVLAGALEARLAADARRFY